MLCSWHVVLSLFNATLAAWPGAGFQNKANPSSLRYICSTREIQEIGLVQKLDKLGDNSAEKCKLHCLKNNIRGSYFKYILALL